MKIEEKFVETKYGRICYLEYGEGNKTAIFFHGFLGGQIHGDSFAQKLSQSGWRVIVLSLPGHKKSFGLPPKYQFQNLVETMEEFVEIVAPKGAVLAGHSLGGAISWEIACHKPSLAKKLILIDPGLKISKRSLVQKGLLAIWNDLVLDRKAMGLIIPTVWNSKLINLLAGMDVSDLPDKIPVLVLWGKNDKVTPMKDGTSKLKNLKNLELKIFEGGHHWYQWQKEKYLQVVEDFI